jgi:hypothetical protein
MTSVKVKTRATDKSAVDSVSRLSMGVLGGVAGVAGLWSIACLVGALTTNGVGGVITGFISAIAG